MLKAQSKDMTEGPILSRAVLYAVTVTLTSILQLLFNAADLIVVGRFAENGGLALAAVGATGAVTALVIGAFFGLSTGAGVTAAHAAGAGDDGAMHRTVHTAISLALVTGAILTAVGVAFSGAFLEWMGTPDDVFPLAKTYMQIYFGGVVFYMLYNFGAAILRAVGDTASPLFYLTAAGVINVGLNLLFVIGFGMSVEGVALATVISQGLSAALIMLNLARRTDGCRFRPAKMRFYRQPLLKMIYIGMPSGIQGAMFSFSNTLIQSSVNSFGSAVMSGNATAANIESFIYLTVNGFYHAALNFTGQNLGAKRFDRVKRVMWCCLACGTVTGFAAGMAGWIFGRQLIGIYTSDPQMIDYGMIRALCLFTGYAFCGSMDALTGSLRGLGKSLSPTLITLLGVCGSRVGFILTMFRLPRFHNLYALFLTYPISWVLTSAALFIAFFATFGKMTKKGKV